MMRLRQIAVGLLVSVILLARAQWAVGLLLTNGVGPVDNGGR